jgi:hypothetical protein
MSVTYSVSRICCPSFILCYSIVHQWPHWSITWITPLINHMNHPTDQSDKSLHLLITGMTPTDYPYDLFQFFQRIRIFEDMARHLNFCLFLAWLVIQRYSPKLSWTTHWSITWNIPLINHTNCPTDQSDESLHWSITWITPYIIPGCICMKLYKTDLSTLVLTSLVILLLSPLFDIFILLPTPWDDLTCWLKHKGNKKECVI